MERKRPRVRPRTKCVEQIRKNIDMRGGNWEEIQENRKWEIKDGWEISL